MRTLGTAVSPVFSDGRRWAAYEPSRGRTVLIDAFHTRDRTVTDPSGCTTLAAVGAGKLLYTCGISNYAVEDARTLTIDRGSSPELVPGSECSATPEQVGAQWIEVNDRCYHVETISFLNWHTGVVHDAELEPATSARDYEDLDSPTLLVPLCRPLRRPVHVGFFNGLRFAPLVFSQGFAVRQGGEGAAEEPIAALARCGTELVQTLTPSVPTDAGAPTETTYAGPPPDFAQLGAGIVTWVTPHRRPYMYVAHLSANADHLYTDVRGFYGSNHDEHDLAALQHTATTVYETVEDRGAGYLIRYARLR